jgi:hypothetical protein
LKTLTSHPKDRNCVEECLRWIVQLHDTYGESLQAPVVDKHSIECIVLLLKRYMDVPTIIQMTAKVLGVLSTHEQNRILVPQQHGVRHLLHAVNVHRDSIKVLANIFWSLVIIARPLGAAEGSTFTHPHKQTTMNIKHIVEAGGIDSIIGIIRRHVHSPHVLTKAYWCLVNLSIVPEHKQKVLELGALQLIVDSLRTFPTHSQLQYRAAFAFINLCILPEVKELLRELGGIELLLDGMKRFPRYRVYQKCACVVIRSLGYSSERNIHRVINRGGIECIIHMIMRWRHISEFVRLGLTTLECLNVAHTTVERVWQRADLIDLIETDEEARKVLSRPEVHGEITLPAIDVDTFNLPDDDDIEVGLSENQIDDMEKSIQITIHSRAG